MVSKREERKVRKILQRSAHVMDLELTHLFIEEMKFDRKMRNKAVTLSKKRKVRYIT